MRSLSMTALATAAAVLAGCGGGGSKKSDETAAFKSDYQPLVNQLESTTKAVGAAIKAAASQTDAQLQSQFKSLADRWQGEVSRLETLNPPRKMQADFNTLKSAATRVESDLNAIVAAAATHSSQPAEQASASLVNDALATKNAAGKVNQQLGIK